MESLPLEVPQQKVKSFQNFPIKPGTSNLLLGIIIIIRNPASDQTLPVGTAIHI